MKTTTARIRQRGVLLLEAMIAILLFSIGVLAVVALQANAIKNVTQSKYRSDAAFLADQLIGQMWANRTNIPSYAYSGGTPPAVMANWVNQIEDAHTGLPMAATYEPTVTVTSTDYAGPPPYTAYQVSVTVYWQTADDSNAGPQPQVRKKPGSRPPPHSFTATALIPCC
jgi:type IV pilus assembly protein PilV